MMLTLGFATSATSAYWLAHEHRL